KFYLRHRIRILTSGYQNRLPGIADFVGRFGIGYQEKPMPNVSVYIRESRTRSYIKANPKELYPPGTVFVLRYEEPKTGKRKCETLDGLMDIRLATVKAKLKEV